MKQTETETEVCTTNLEKLKRLVDDLDTYHQKSDEYRSNIRNIGNVIKEEKKVINRMVKDENKLAHYENICATILTIISTIKTF